VLDGRLRPPNEHFCSVASPQECERVGISPILKKSGVDMIGVYLHDVLRLPPVRFDHEQVSWEIMFATQSVKRRS
jgi:hypothetical protein